MDKQIHLDETKIDEENLESFLGQSSLIIKNHLGQPHSKSENEWVYYVNKKQFFGFFRVKLYLFFKHDVLREFYVGY